MLESIKTTAEKILESKNGSVLEFNGEKDHVHILFEIPPQETVSKIVNSFKTVSSRIVRRDFKNQLEKYLWKDSFWSKSYCIISTGGASIETIKKYIQSQSSPS